MNCCYWLILYSRTRTRVPNSMCLDHLHKYQVERTGGISPSNLWKKLWIFFFFSETNVKKDDLRRVHLSYSVFEGVWCCHSKPHVQSTSLSKKCELEKKIRIWKRQKTKTFQMKHTELLEISLAIISIWKLVTQGSNHTEGNLFFFFFLCTGQFKHN